jgi:hypothetical protein
MQEKLLVAILGEFEEKAALFCPTSYCLISKVPLPHIASYVILECRG